MSEDTSKATYFTLNSPQDIRAAFDSTITYQVTNWNSGLDTSNKMGSMSSMAPTDIAIYQNNRICYVRNWMNVTLPTISDPIVTCYNDLNCTYNLSDITAAFTSNCLNDYGITI